MERIELSKITTIIILLVAVVSFLAGTYVRPYASTTPNSVPTAAATPAGRYTFVVNPSIKNEKFLLDTQTGKLWQLAKSESGETAAKPSVSQNVNRVSHLDHPRSAKLSKGGHAKEKVTMHTVAQPDNNVTIEVISSSKISKTKVPRNKYAGTITPSSSGTTISIKTPIQASL